MMAQHSSAVRTSATKKVLGTNCTSKRHMLLCTGSRVSATGSDAWMMRSWTFFLGSLAQTPHESFADLPFASLAAACACRIVKPTLSVLSRKVGQSKGSQACCNRSFPPEVSTVKPVSTVRHVSTVKHVSTVRSDV